ncbi:MAG: HEAT repeat domain-containing protein [Planctomycetota bacterium]|jgi:pimeloyl-ACP methyl ester carboxylesterase
MRTALLLLLVLAAAPLAAEEDGYDKVLDRYRKQMKRKDLERRAEAFRILDPGNPRSLPELKAGLTQKHWYMRGHAAEVLSSVTKDALRAELRLDLLTHEDDRVREGIALAFALSPEKGDAEALSEALTDGAWEVRRTAAAALSEIVSRESLEKLIAAIVKESDPRVAVLVADTLRKVTGQNLGRDGDAWSRWWELNKDREEFKSLDEEKKRRKLGGIPLSTVTVPARRGPDGRVLERLDFFLLAPFGWSHDVYRPYLDELSRFGRITYVDLPRVRELTGQSGFGPSIPTYPVKKLVRALEELRAELGKRKVVVLGEGATGWIAERYAITYPKRTGGVVILNGYVDAASYAAALGRLSRSPVPAERWVAKTLTDPNSGHEEATYRRLVRIMLTSDLADPGDSRAYLLWKDSQDPQGFARVPHIQFSARAKFETPTLFFFGAQSRLSGFPERSRIEKHFPKRIIAPLTRSRGFPYVSEYAEFYRILEGFLSHYGLLK